MAREKGLARKETGELLPLESWNTFRDMERMFRDFFMSPLAFPRPTQWLSEMTREFAPEVNLKETDKEFELTANIPGLNKDDIDIDVTDDRITVSGEVKREEEQPGETYHIRQQSYGSFKVSYVLPSEVKPDEVKATYKDGVLRVNIPKAEEVKAHKVKVSAEEGK